MNKDVLELMDAQSSDRGLTKSGANTRTLTTQFVEGQKSSSTVAFRSRKLTPF